MDILARKETENFDRILESRGISKDYDRNLALTADFFTGAMPLMKYVLFREAWL